MGDKGRRRKENKGEKESNKVTMCVGERKRDEWKQVCHSLKGENNVKLIILTFQSRGIRIKLRVGERAHGTKREAWGEENKGGGMKAW